MVRHVYATIGLLAILTAGVSSQAVKPIGPLGPSTTSSGLAKSGQALINGVAVDTNAVPLANAKVQLRNLAENRIEQVGTANQVGQFTFLAHPEVPYVIEIADHAGRIVAVGDVITPQAGDVAGAIVTIPSRLPLIAGIFDDTASSVISAAINGGIAAIDPAPPLSPEK